jgi:hypothetical protein
VPKIGPFRPLSFKVPTPEAEALFLDSLSRTRERFGAALTELQRGQLQLTNVNLDTGQPDTRGAYRLADETFREWEKRRASASAVKSSAAAAVPAARAAIAARRTRALVPPCEG